MKIIKSLYLIISIILIIIVIFSTCQNKNKDHLKIACAANFYPTFEKLITTFEGVTGEKISVITGSSGALTTLIEQGAPYYLFYSADSEYPQRLFDSGKTDLEPKPYANGKLVLWSKTIVEPLSINSILSSEYRSFAIPNPRLAPYGKASMEVLGNLDQLTFLESKLVYGENVSQTNQFIVSESAELGITSLSTIFSLDDEERGNYYIIDESLYSPIVQSFIVLDHPSEFDQIIIDFMEFMNSTEAKEIIISNGYDIPD